MTDQHPITPSPELMKEWIDAWYNAKVKHDNMTEFVAIQAARWGYQQCMKLDAAWLEAKLQKARDQELQACCEWLKAKEWVHPEFSDELHYARRPKPQSLKEQALAWCNDYIDPDGVIRRALEQLDD